MKFKQRFYPILSSSPLSLSALIKNTQHPLLLPTYHTISDKSLAHIKHLYPIKNTAQFVMDLEYLLKNFRPVSIEEIWSHINGDKVIHQPAFHLSFDDGMKECIDLIAPILKSKGIAASFYINSDFVDNQHLFYRHQVSLLIEKITTEKQQLATDTEDIFKATKQIFIKNNLWTGSLIDSIRSLKFHHQSILKEAAASLQISFSEYLNQQQPYMKLLEINQLYQDGFHIGAHSVSHPDYQDISSEARIRQTIPSIDFVKKHFPSKVTTFAFPYSSIGIPNSFFEILNQHVDVSFGTSGLKLDSVANHLHRFPMEGADFSPQRMIKGEYNAYWLKKLARKHVFNRT